LLEYTGIRPFNKPLKNKKGDPQAAFSSTA
jgi:hypothetical protein